ncbi:unnamed protein product, partial [Enterobius vermicularis]|uniref:Rho-GAP domain-containing protein n=1 Tax=Enterobius vermicularis TaxID=51028 RepID=A0A0N4VFR0_ENTVE
YRVSSKYFDSTRDGGGLLGKFCSFTGKIEDVDEGPAIGYDSASGAQYNRVAEEDEHVYANMEELREESMRKENPPTPDFFRSYFFNRERGECSWKPPRFQKNVSCIGYKENNVSEASSRCLLEKNSIQVTISIFELDNNCSEAGVTLKKKEWTSCYVFLSAAHLIFYKDARSAEKLGRHYEAPLGMCELRGANLQWFDDKRRKHLTLIDGTVYLFNTLNCQDINSWFHAIKRVIRKQVVLFFCFLVIVETCCHLFVLQAIKRNMAKSAPNKAKIIHRLKRFFRSRPSLETLKEKGIYKTEPVFGNTLLGICHQEKSLVPKFIFVVTEVIELLGLDTDGIYRVSGNLSSIQRIRFIVCAFFHFCQKSLWKYTDVLHEEDIHVLTGALKLFFRELAEPVFPHNISKDLIAANTKIQKFDEIIKTLPVVHRETLRTLFVHLLKVSRFAKKNRMEIHNLAIVFGPSLFSAGADALHKGKKGEKKNLEATGVQNNSHFVFNMIMQGQILEYLLTEFDNLLKTPLIMRFVLLLVN